jgi:hypothetical protein
LSRKHENVRESVAMQVLAQIPVMLDHAEIQGNFRTGGNEWAERLEPLMETLRPRVFAKAVYKVAYVDSRLADGVVIDGIRFTSKVLRKHLDEAGRVFPYVVTIGNALEDKRRLCTDMLDQYFLDTVGTIAVVKARKHLEEHLRSKFHLERLSFMGPGSLPDWPIQEQRPLFALLGDVEGAIGVKLTQTLLMNPVKSLSGIYFPTQVPFSPCQLCPRENCPSRKAKYSEMLAKEYGIR